MQSLLTREETLLSRGLSWQETDSGKPFHQGLANLPVGYAEQSQALSFASEAIPCTWV